MKDTSDRLTALKFLFDHHARLEIDSKNPNHWIMDFGDSFVDWVTTAPNITFDELFDCFIRPSVAGAYKMLYECCPHDTDIMGSDIDLIERHGLKAVSGF